MIAESTESRGFRRLLGEPGWRGLLALGRPRVYPDGATLLHQGDQGSDVLALTAGRVKVVHTEESGEQKLLALRGAGDLLGEYAAPLAGTGRGANVVALERCEARVIQWPVLSAYFARNDCSLEFHGYLISKANQATHRPYLNTHLTPELRIARLLLEAVELVDGSVRDPARIPFEHTEIAPLLGMVRSTFAVHVKRLKEIGALRAERHLFLGDKAVLRSVAGV
ncbi:transcriptional regulator, Crp/Fnr family [Actinosynnema pretiosum subsp. pretiosum]|nr:transcriptional regulator, Crp/Fnr family [Actinosynnema pretiosum subsp. pretiosum]